MDEAMSSLKTGSKVQMLSSTMPPHLRKGSLLPEAEWKSVQRQRSPRLSKSEWLAVHGEAARAGILREIQRRRELEEGERRRQKKVLERTIREEEQQRQRHRAEWEEEVDREYEEEEEEYEEDEEESSSSEEEEEKAEERRVKPACGQTRRQAGMNHSPEGGEKKGGDVDADADADADAARSSGAGRLTDLTECMKFGRINLDPPQKEKLSQIDEARDKIGKAFRKHEAMKEFKFDPEDDFVFEKRLWEKDYVYKKPWLVEEVHLK